MKAVHVFGPGDVRLVTVPDPAPGEGQVRIRVMASGICGSDKWLWRSPGPDTRVHGHEVAGEVIERGPGVRRLKVGDRVAVNNVVGCGVCPACRAGAYVKCPRWDGSRDVGGGFGEYVVAPERNCLKVDDAIDIKTAAQIFDNLGTPFSAIEHAGIRPGDDVLVTGCGPIGLGAIILLARLGAFVIAADPLPARREFAASLGARAALPPDDTLPGEVHDLTEGSGARFVLECSGKSPVYPLALAALKIGGTLVSVGEGAQVDLHPSDTLIRRHLTLTGSWYSSMAQGARVQGMILQKEIDPSILVTDCAPLSEFPRLFRKVCEQPEQVIKALIVNP